MRSRLPVTLAVAAVATAATFALGTATVLAQIEGGDRGVAAIDSSNDFEVTGVEVNVTGPNAEAARLAGWREAQRKGFVQLSRRLGAGGGLVADGVLDSIVSSIVIDQEQIGPTRYVARLGVLFDRDRTAGLLGIASYVARSRPLVVVPVVWSTGVGTAFEQRTAWQEAWARYRTGSSEVDYIRPVGNGPDPLLLNVGQSQRPDRRWWRTVLDQYGGDDVLLPTARLYRRWPGGPVVGVFEARHGPDNRLIARFALRVSAASGLPKLLDAAVARMDTAYQSALRGGYLRPDPGLTYTPPETALTADLLPTEDPLEGTDLGALPAITSTITVQYDSPGVSAVSGTEGAVRSITGVSSASTVSLALGGISAMSVTYGGTPEAFRAALEARGWQVFGSGATLRIRRAPQLLPPDLQAENATAG